MAHGFIRPVAFQAEDYKQIYDTQILYQREIAQCPYLLKDHIQLFRK